ncbi:1590_t:CDS:2 [Diversispora eburnea]|uniref:1590_t:CDS:1 n=1 Tax=Diversispora eburnea TaxID=1213867 RepID=A0A9N8YPP4_9GLOM|nr:1590_t:CDS:2 [Diversispora eburnea]
MFNRIIISCIGGFISVYCAVVALLTFFQINFATYHFPGVLNAGFASMYGILSPIGLTGVLGGINRKRNLIKGFLFQYWISSILMIGLSVTDILLFDQYHKFALDKCSSSLSIKERKNSQAICNNRLRNNEKITFIAAYIQGGVLVFMGIVLLYCGYKELKEIKFD